MRALLVLIVLSTFVLSASAYVTPPNAYCGNPPQNRYCNYCHDDDPLNSGNGYIQLSGLPAGGFVPNQTYSLTLTLADPGQIRWAFEIAAEYLSGSTWVQAGNFTITQSSYTTLSTSSGISYVKNNSSGTFAGTPGPTSWQFNWRAPAATVPSVNFYFAGAACDNDNETGNDFVYGQFATVNQYVAPQPPVVSDIPNQQIAYGGSFSTINLDDYVTDPDTPDNQIIWTYSGNTNIAVSIVNRVATPTPAPGWWGGNTITFTATDPTSLSDSDDAVFTVNSALPPIVYVSVEGENVVLTWDSIANMDEYHIYYSDAPYFTPQSPPQAVVLAPANSWTDIGAVNIEQRFYLIRAASN